MEVGQGPNRAVVPKEKKTRTCRFMYVEAEQGRFSSVSFSLPGSIKCWEVLE
jgi:hypothetical protein